MATASNGFGMTVSPAVIPQGQSAVTITDSGTTPLHLVTQAVSLNGKCQPTSEVSWARITPAAITLQPGQRKTAHVHLVSVPSGRHAIAVMFESLGGGKGQVQVNAELGARMTVGHGTAKPCAVATAPPGHGSGAMPTLVIALVIAFVIGGILAAVHTARRRGAHQQG